MRPHPFSRRQPATELLWDSVSQPAKLTVWELFQRHIHRLSSLPGEVSQFEETGVGYEWRCQCTLQEAAELDGVPVDFMLQFSLLDLEGSQQPVAALYLAQQVGQEQRRWLLPLGDESALTAQLQSELSSCGASVDAMSKARLFLDALEALRSATHADVSWG